jgi:hypothetical protein
LRTAPDLLRFAQCNSGACTGLGGVRWDVGPRDFEEPGPEVIYGRTSPSIVLLHDDRGEPAPTAEAVDEVLDESAAGGRHRLHLLAADRTTVTLTGERRTARSRIDGLTLYRSRSWTATIAVVASTTKDRNAMTNTLRRIRVALSDLVAEDRPAFKRLDASPARYDDGAWLRSRRWFAASEEDPRSRVLLLRSLR